MISHPRIVAAILAFAGICSQASAERLVLASASYGKNVVAICDAEGKILWSHKTAGGASGHAGHHDIQFLDNGNILFHENWTTIIEMTLDKKVVWTYDSSALNGNKGKRVQAFDPDERTVTVTTTQSFKGYDAEVVVIGGVERFIGQKKILANNLYVAMTRARSILAIFAYDQKSPGSPASEILLVIENCLNAVLERPKVEKEISHLDDIEDVLDRIGGEHREWLGKLWKSRSIEQEPIVTAAGEILAEPLFWFKDGTVTIACFCEDSPGVHTLQKLEDANIQIIRPGTDVDDVIRSASNSDPGICKPVSLPPKRLLASAPRPVTPNEPRYTPKYVVGHWCVTRYALNGKPMSDRRVFPTKEQAEKYAATMQNVQVKPTVEQLT